VDPEIARGMDYWWFLYFGNGMNLKDAALLRFKNIQEDFIIFRRAKTDRTSSATMLPISVYINEDMRAIIERRGNKSESPENFIFPILNSEMNPLQQHDEIKAFIRLINRSAQIACKEIGLSKKCTTKVSRHSFMTQQKRNGASIEEIQEAVGHTSPSTTQFYLDSFELEMKRSLANNTCKFKEA
jgi:integrase